MLTFSPAANPSFFSPARLSAYPLLNKTDKVSMESDQVRDRPPASLVLQFDGMFENFHARQCVRKGPVGLMLRRRFSQTVSSL